MDEEFYDVVVVGSGFGGAVTACRAAQAGQRVLVLERGAQYRPGQFARSPREMSTNVWDPSERLFGLFDLWSFRHLDAVVASGVGGGSLIYANVMLRMPEEWFAAAKDRWPLAYADIAEHYDEVERMLGATPLPKHLLPLVPKARVFEDAAHAAGFNPVPAKLAVTFPEPEHQPGAPFGAPQDNLHKVQRRTCQLCGQCDFGCNDGAKNTLDLTYLSQAVATGLATVRPLHEVKRIDAIGPPGDGEEYRVHYVVHDPPDQPSVPARRPLVPRQELRTVRARTVAMAAGAFGTTWLLLANRAGLPRLGGALGTRFSGNGDALGFVTGGDDVVDSQRGPVITRIAQHDGYFVQDGGYPALLGWLGEALHPALYARAAQLGVARSWERMRGRADSRVSTHLTRLLGSVGVSRSTMPLLAMGLDPGVGTMRLDGKRLDLHWSYRRSRDYPDRVQHTMAELASAAGARFRPGPSTLLTRAISAHPLGGCPMGPDPVRGVVDNTGRTFGHKGLFVVDGSVIPSPIGANPSLTIAALAEHFAKTIIERKPT